MKSGVFVVFKIAFKNKDERVTIRKHSIKSMLENHFNFKMLLKALLYGMEYNTDYSQH